MGHGQHIQPQVGRAWPKFDGHRFTVREPLAVEAMIGAINRHFLQGKIDQILEATIIVGQAQRIRLAGEESG